MDKVLKKIDTELANRMTVIGLSIEMMGNSFNAFRHSAFQEEIYRRELVIYVLNKIRVIFSSSINILCLL